MRRLILFAAAPACVLLALSPVIARAELAPPGSASATALQVGDLVRVSDTGATAAPETASASASVVEVGGEPVLGLGGSQTGPGQSSGALLDTGSSLPAQAQVAPWETSVSGSASERSSQGSAAAARAQIPDVAEAAVLQSESKASHRAEKSTGSGSSDGAVLQLFDVARIVLLHSEVSSEGKGSSHLVGINDLEVGSDEQLGEICALHASPLLMFSCLTASGGVGGDGLTTGAAELATVESALAPLNPVAAFAVDSASGSGTPSLPAPVPAPAAAETETARALPGAAPTVAGETEERLPRTGATVATLALIALLTVGSGVALRLAGRRRAIV
jgi:hypothetical protein